MKIAQELGVTDGAVTQVGKRISRSVRIEKALADALQTSPEQLFPDLCKVPSYDLKTVQAMHDAGLVAQATFGGGFCAQTKVDLTPEQVVQYLDQGLDFVLKLLGIDPTEFEEWQASDGRALCMEILKNGQFCGNQVASQCSLEDWKRLHRNEYCHTHS